MSNIVGLEQTIAALTELKPAHAALLATARGLAAAVDEDPTSAALWREYRAAVADLREVGAADDVDDAAVTFLHSVSTPLRPAVGNGSQS